MSFRFEKLDVWQRARKFTSDIYRISSKFPKEEIYGLTSQIRRAAVSISLNIAEGSDRKSDADFVRFLRISIGSTEEVVTALYIALDLNFISKNDFETLYKETNILMAQLNALANSLLKRK